MNQLPEAAREIARRAADAARETTQRATDTAKDVTGLVEHVAAEVTDATRDAAKYATEMAKDMYQSAALKAGDTLATSKEYVRRNPVPVVLGAIAFGAAIGYMLMMARRKQTFGERYAEIPDDRGARSCRSRLSSTPDANPCDPCHPGPRAFGADTARAGSLRGGKAL